ncbi:hypothetical protein KFE25_007865 [Diacronema lutheri]|uniref:Uncharacterized protein n=1 Tax=Diacronema lutheri TaxID=2081491 RepID=A0A8J5XVF9_DIALT|nr:hypothetical protein KFE25_007865 [Diacronema lutheri]
MDHGALLPGETGEERGAASGVVLVGFDGDRPIFRRAASDHSDGDVDDLVIEDEPPPAYHFSAGISRNIAYEIEDDEPTFRSFSTGGALAADTNAPAPPSLCRQRGFAPPGLYER